MEKRQKNLITASSYLSVCARVASLIVCNAQCAQEHLYLLQPPVQEELQEEEAGHTQEGVGEEEGLHLVVEEVVEEVGLQTLKVEEEVVVAEAQHRQQGELLHQVVEEEGEELQREQSDWLVPSLEVEQEYL